MLKLGKNSAAWAVAAVLVAACSQGDKQGDAPAAVAGGTLGYEAVAFGPATITDQGGVITSTRTGAGSQGVSVTSEPVLIRFAVEGPGSRVRVRREGDWVDVPRAEQYAIMVGRGGASSINAYSREGRSVTVRVADVTPCSQTQCTPIAAPTPSN
jgi:hypothetical protein